MKSRFNRNYFYNQIIIFALAIFLNIFFLLRTIKIILEDGFKLKFIWWYILILFLNILILFFFNSIKIIKIHRQNLQCYSILRPFGKILNFIDYKAIFNITETGRFGSYKVIYLVDHNDITRFKIMGLYYENMDEIISAIPLPVIKKSLSPKEYMKLLFTGRVNLSKVKDKKGKNTEIKMAFYFKIFSAVTILIFVIGMLIKILSK